MPPLVSSKIIAKFDDKRAVEILLRISALPNMDEETIKVLEDNLEDNLLDKFDVGSEANSLQMIFDIFNNFNKSNEMRFTSLIEKADKELFSQIKANIFGFDDIVKIDDAGMKTVVSAIDKIYLPKALKGAKEELQVKFLGNMSERAAKIIREDMGALGAIRMKDVEEAQGIILNNIKELIDNGSVNMESEDGDDGLVE